MRAARSLLSVSNSLNETRDLAHESSPDFYDDAGDDTRRSVPPRSDGDVNDNGASVLSAGQHGDVLGALWECYHMVTPSAAARVMKSLRCDAHSFSLLHR